MKILIISQYFYPETFIINDLALELKNRGHEITVLTGLPNYPDGKIYPSYGYFKKRKDKYKGIKVYRSILIPRGSSSGFRLFLNYLSFVFGALLAFRKIYKKDIDLIFVYEPSPITVCIPAIIIKKIKKVPICLWVLDLWPESVYSATNIKSRFFSNLLNPLIKIIYSYCDSILISSKGFINSITEKGVSEDKIKYFPQWAETIFKPIKESGSRLLNLRKNSFKIMFAGNIGEAQDFSSIIQAGKILKNKIDIEWIIIGSGRKENWLRNEILENGLGEYFRLLGRFPINEMPNFFAHADCMLVSLRNTDIFKLTIPAKIQTYMASGKPILGMISGEAATVIKEAKAGLVSPAESPNLLVDNIIKLKEMNKKDLEKLGSNGYVFFKKEFERETMINKFEKICNDLLLE